MKIVTSFLKRKKNVDEQINLPIERQSRKPAVYCRNK